jgi:predicted nucleic acid-binding protein
MAPEPMHAPAIFDGEVFGVVRRHLRLGLIDQRTALAAIFELRRALIQRHALTPMLLDAFAVRDRFGPGDVFYAVLARRLDATLLTCDLPLHDAANGMCRVVYVPPRG